MIKKTVTFTDWDDQEQTQDLYFNLTRTDLMNHLDLESEFKDMAELLGGGERELKVDEIQRMLNLVKRIVEMSYGARTGPDLKRFVKSPDVFEDFRWSAAYDAFLWGLFDNPEEAISFINGVIPADLRAEAEAEIKRQENLKTKKVVKK